MDKKDIYEHLAKIYLDASLKRKKKGKKYSSFSKNFFFTGITFIIALSTFLITQSIYKNRFINSDITLVLCPEAVKINFNFDPAKKEIFSINLNRLNLTRFKTLAFSVKKATYQQNLALRVEFVNNFKEKSEIYLKDISHKWQEHIINLSQFRNITDWSEMVNLAFIVEEWNVSENKGVVYIDNVRFLK